MHSYPKHFLPWFWSVIGVLFVTGLLLIPGALELRLEWDVPISLGGARIGIAALHALAAFATLVAVGALIPVHMRLGLRQRRNHVTGLTLVGCFGVLLLTALGIYYLAGPALSVVSSVLHTVLGLLLALPLTWHWIRGRRLHHRRASAVRSHSANALTDQFRPVI